MSSTDFNVVEHPVIWKAHSGKDISYCTPIVTNCLSLIPVFISLILMSLSVRKVLLAWVEVFILSLTQNHNNGMPC